MDGRPSRTAFSNSFGLVWTLPYQHYLSVLLQKRYVSCVLLNRLYREKFEVLPFTERQNFMVWIA